MKEWLNQPATLGDVFICVGGYAIGDMIYKIRRSIRDGRKR